ncbi:4-hydroxythreonine-4-phosphate dehydrogenase PdxA [Limibacter armeniacum]|uniref:4-hydroxythreonine-4-phosphate dehydrogenase PdxA n=1 Tax=Limibacter armeniacum TaxID=466084 RepID=UPI002FE59B2E
MAENRTREMDNSKQQNTPEKPKIGITIGDYNGVGPEIIIKVMQDKRIMNMCTPVIYGSGKILTKYKRMLNMEDFSYHQYNSNSYLNEKKPNVVNCWADPQEVQPGKVTESAGKSAYLSLQKSTDDLKTGNIDAVVTSPINKANIQRDEFRYAGHTEYYADKFGNENDDTLMLLCSDDLRVGVITGHIPLSKVPSAITKELIISKTEVLIKSLEEDFGIQRPKVAILGLNPHAGEDGLLGSEELEIIAPAITEMNQNGQLVFGPYPADGFFGTMLYKKFDGVLAMYHDQGLIPFKTLAFENGVNYTAGLPVVRTSPDHGTAYNIAGKGIANEDSLREAIYLAVDIVKNRRSKVERKIRPNAKQLLSEMKEESKKQAQIDREKDEQRQLEAELAKQQAEEDRKNAEQRGRKENFRNSDRSNFREDTSARQATEEEKEVAEESRNEEQETSENADQNQDRQQRPQKQHQNRNRQNRNQNWKDRKKRNKRNFEGNQGGRPDGKQSNPNTPEQGKPNPDTSRGNDENRGQVRNEGNN